MELKQQLKKHENFILATAWILFLILAVAVRYDFYYDLNDDVLMKDILSGAYTGVPEGHNIQMLYLISAFISVFYRICRGVPWYGIFLCVCQFGSLYLVVKRSLCFVQKLWVKLGLLILELGIVIATLLPHLVYVQYTITTTILASAAAFLFFTNETYGTPLQYLRRNSPVILMVSVAFLIRSEMLLLVFPLICVAGLLKWSMEQPVFTKELFCKYLGVFGVILLGLAVGQGTHMLAYSSPEWQRFNTYFDNRTELYDFQVIPDYESNEAFYNSVGLTQGEQELLINYNFGLDEEIDETLVGEIAAYAGEHRKADIPFVRNLKESLKLYCYRLSHGKQIPESEFPWNYLVIAGYLAVLAVLLLQKKWLQLWQPVLLFGVRTGLWMYILMRGRSPERITHSLYLMEFCILMAWLLVLLHRSMPEKNAVVSGASDKGTIRFQGNGVPVIATLFCSVVFLLSTAGSYYAVTEADAEQVRRAQVNRPYEALLSYCKAQEENFYFLDVYSTVAYSEKMFVNVDNSLANHDIMGGWACKSPLYRKKLAAFEIQTMEEAVKDQSNVYVIAENENDMEWLRQYYAEHEVDISLKAVDVIADTMTVYQVR